METKENLTEREKFEAELKKINKEANQKIAELILRSNNPPAIVSGGFKATYL